MLAQLERVYSGVWPTGKEAGAKVDIQRGSNHAPIPNKSGT